MSPSCLPAPPSRSLRLLLRRDSGGFTERDKLLVEVLRPHLHAVYQDAQRRRTGVPRLTARQWELLRLVAAGHSNAEIARQLFLSENTVRKHLENIYQRLSVSSRTAAVVLAFQSGYPTQPAGERRTMNRYAADGDFSRRGAMHIYAGWPGCSLEGTWDCRAAGERGGLLLPARLPAVISLAVRRCLGPGRVRMEHSVSRCPPVVAGTSGGRCPLRCALVGSASRALGRAGEREMRAGSGTLARVMRGRLGREQGGDHRVGDEGGIAFGGPAPVEDEQLVEFG